MSKRLSDDEKRYFTDQITMLKGENERLTKGIEDLGEENETLRERIALAIDGIDSGRSIDYVRNVLKDAS